MSRLNEEHFRCSCYAHSVSVSKFKDYPEIEVEVWAGDGVTLNWRNLWQRIRDAWKFVRTGSVMLHAVVLYPEDASRMGAKLIELAEQSD